MPGRGHWNDRELKHEQQSLFRHLRHHLWLGGVGTPSPCGLPNAGPRRRLGFSNVAVVERLRSGRRFMRMGVSPFAAIVTAVQPAEQVAEALLRRPPIRSVENPRHFRRAAETLPPVPCLANFFAKRPLPSRLCSCDIVGYMTSPTCRRPLFRFRTRTCPPAMPFPPRRTALRLVGSKATSVRYSGTTSFQSKDHSPRRSSVHGQLPNIPVIERKRFPQGLGGYSRRHREAKAKPVTRAPRDDRRDTCEGFAAR